MADNDSTLKDIESGKGLKPIPSQPANNTAGVTTEQRGQDSGVRRDIFTYQDEKKDDKP